MMFEYRENTFDRGIQYDIFAKNIYRVSSEFKSNDIVLDIGAHVGYFSVFAAMKGSRRVIAFEPFIENYRQLVKHSVPFKGAIVPIYGAVWRPTLHKFMCYQKSSDPANTGGGFIKEPSDTEVGYIPVFSLDSILDFIGDEVRFLKLDCEASEFPILYGCTQLHKIKEIAGEYHIGPNMANFEMLGQPKQTVNSLFHYLQDNGFKVEIEQTNHELGYFFAKR